MPQPIRVLIVENELNVARPLSRALGLAGAGRYDVDMCSCAESALAKVALHHCDIVLTDLELPGIGGVELLRRVREISPHTRSILMTARGATKLESLAPSSAEGYLLKPFGLSDFLEIVERLAHDPDATMH
jgi:DNA-binding NtrC family response regulator